MLGSRRPPAFAALSLFAMLALSAAMPGAFAQGPAYKQEAPGRPGNVVHAVASAAEPAADIVRIQDRGGDDKHDGDGSSSHSERDNSGGRHHRHGGGNDDNDGGSGSSGSNDDDGDNNRNSGGSSDGERGGSGGDDRCNCIVVRLDDVQDEWVRDVQLVVLDKLISERVHTSTAIIMNEFGNDSGIVSKVREGGDAGLFEYVIHGWDHVDYATLSLEEQKNTLSLAKAKLTGVLGADSDIFATPYNSFNEDTLNAMDQLGMNIITSDETDLFPAAPRESPLFPSVAHMPQTINFADQVGEVRILRPLAEIMSAIRTDIQDKGYAVLTLHPQDFTKYKGTEVQNEVNPVAMTELEQFIKTARAAGFSFEGFQQALDDNHPDLSTVPDMSNPYERILTPGNGTSFTANSTVTVTGRAIDDTGVESVEVRTTDSSYRAASTDNDFEDWTKTVRMPPEPGSTDIIAKATDDAGKQTWVQITVHVTAQ
ncbi:MAG: polysaccharide deacetylase family protein [Nitrososphaera sp.]